MEWNGINRGKEMNHQSINMYDIYIDRDIMYMNEIAEQSSSPMRNYLFRGKDDLALPWPFAKGAREGRERRCQVRSFIFLLPCFWGGLCLLAFFVGVKFKRHQQYSN